MQKLVNQTYQLAENAVESFRKQLILDEKREATIQKYTHDVRRFLSYHGKQTVCKEDVIQYKAWLAEHYAQYQFHADCTEPVFTLSRGRGLLRQAA